MDTDKMVSDKVIGSMQRDWNVPPFTGWPPTPPPLPWDLRDWFAGQALVGVDMASESWSLGATEALARQCYRVADAMMRVREEKANHG